MSFPKAGSKELVLKLRLGSGEVESELKLVYVVLSVDKPEYLDSVAVTSNDSENSKDQAFATSSPGKSSNGVGTFPTWSEIRSGTGGGMPSRF
jgi:hypothetical protein